MHASALGACKRLYRRLCWSVRWSPYHFKCKKSYQIQKSCQIEKKSPKFVAKIRRQNLSQNLSPKFVPKFVAKDHRRQNLLMAHASASIGDYVGPSVGPSVGPRITLSAKKVAKVKKNAKVEKSCQSKKKSPKFVAKIHLRRMQAPL
jgi:hypothetical protein